MNQFPATNIQETMVELPLHCSNQYILTDSSKFVHIF